MRGAAGYPVMKREAPAPVHCYGRVDRSFRYYTSVQRAVFRISPGAFVMLKVFAAGHNLIKMGQAIDQKVPVFFVMDQRERLRIVKCSIAYLIFIESKIMVQEYTDVAV